MTDTAWYLNCSADQVGDRAILVGDRGRVLLGAELLGSPELINEDRGLTTVTGGFRGQRVTIASFGMGAPIAAIVMHELAALGIPRFLRLGTAFALGPTNLGDLVLADEAARFESTSSSYLPLAYPAVPDRALNASLQRELEASERAWRQGRFASFDGFYSELFALEPERAPAVQERLETLETGGVIAVDMETSAVLAVALALEVKAASLCLASVDPKTHDKLEFDTRVHAERELLEIGLTALTAED